VKKHVLIMVTLALVFIMPATCLASFNQLYWQYYKELPVTGNGFTAIKLDQQVMRNCREDFLDLRVTDTAGREISSQVIQPDKERMGIPATELDRIEYPAYTSLVLDLGNNPQAHNRIELDMNTVNDFMREITLEGSQDNRNWGKIGMGRIMMFHGKIYNTISFTTNTSRYLRVNIKQIPGEKRLELLAARIYFIPASLYEGRLIPSKVVSARSDRSVTNIVIDLHTPNYFVKRVIIKTTDRNYERSVSVSSDDQTNKSNQTLMLNTDPIFDYQWQNYSSTRNYIEVNQYVRRYLLLSIENGNSAPLKITGIQVSASPPYLLADLKGPARLWYGNRNVPAESYDLGKFVSLIQLSDLKWVTPGPQQLNPDYHVPWTEGHKWLLDALIIMVAALFILIIIKNFDKLREPGLKDKIE